jgi:L-2-hydroxyglutarate oxidase LhgO
MAKQLEAQTAATVLDAAKKHSDHLTQVARGGLDPDHFIPPGEHFIPSAEHVMPSAEHLIPPAENPEPPGAQ